MRKLLILALSLIFAMGFGTVFAEEPTGEQILGDLEFKNILSASGSAELTLITENVKGVQRDYSVRVFRKSDDSGEKQFLEYLAPADVRGTKFLSLAEKGQDDQMWLYMPALGRERRVAAHMTGDSFMGTDFTYEEIGGSIVYEDQYSAQRLADAEVEGVSCYVLDLRAKDGSAQYEKVQMWVWKEELIPLRVEFWHPAPTLKKTLTLGNFRLVEGELIPHRVVMADNVQGTRTILEINKISQEEIDEQIFTVRYLRR